MLKGLSNFSSVFEGKKSDSASLGDIVDNIRELTSAGSRAIVVLDAGISTEDNLMLLEQKGYDYVCVCRAKLDIEDQESLWGIYNTIREIESSFRCLKTDLDLRPIYHKNDDTAIAHIHLRLLAYWLVNTIRYQLRKKKITNNVLNVSGVQ